MLDELKSKLGFGGGAVRGRSNDRYDDYDDDYGDYEDDYSEYAEYADDYADGSENDYDPYAPVTTRSARSNSTISNLVSINDVRAHFHACGLTTSYPRERDLTLHLTLLNARHRRLADGTHPPDLVPFDAHPITSRSELRNTDLGVVHIDQVRIDIMGAGPEGYTPIAAVNTP